MSNKHNLRDDQISKILIDTDNLTKTLQSGINSALLKHKQAGNSVCEWRNNKVAWVSADQIRIDKQHNK